jgi:16S rRNA (uracil1498-N3)-methyltransferase
MEIGRPASIVDLIRDTPAAGPRFVANPGGLPLPTAWSAAAVSGNTRTVLVAIGPEGGFSDAEVEQLLAAGWEHVSLGSSILRIETAAIAVAAWARLSAEASCPV